MSGVLRLGNTGAATGRSTIQATATSDATFSLPSAGGTLLTSNYSAVGTITLDGSTVNITNGDLNVDSGTLFVDESTNHVGIGNTSPSCKLHITGATGGGIAGIWDTTAGGARVEYKDNGTRRGFLNWDTNSLLLAVDSGNNIKFSTNAGVTQHATIDSSGRFLLGGATSGAYDVELKKSGQPHILIGSTNALGATLLLDGDSNGDGIGSDYASLTHFSDGNLILENRKTASILFRNTSSSTTRMIIDSEGDIGIGTTGAQKRLHVRDDSDSYPLLVQNRTNAVSTCGVALIATGSDFADGQYATIEALSGGTGSTQHELRFRTCTSGGTPSERIRILANGGLTFNGDTAQANALDDYEEGTFTPAFNGTITYTGSLTGNYTKIGRVVYFSVGYSNQTFSNATGGVAKITGLPFTANSDSINRSAFFIGYSDVTTNESGGGYVEDGTTNIIFYDSGTRTTSTFSNGTGKYLYLSGFYLV